jgi:hypothetical protein
VVAVSFPLGEQLAENVLDAVDAGARKAHGAVFLSGPVGRKLTGFRVVSLAAPGVSVNGVDRVLSGRRSVQKCLVFS